MFQESGLETKTELDNPDLYLDRELNWIDFNQKVLTQARDTRLPLLERTRFLAIYFNNLDEFFMVRVAGLASQYAGGISDAPPTMLSPARRIILIRKILKKQIAEAYKCWDMIKEELSAAGLPLLSYDEVRPSLKERLKKYFMKEIFPVLTPQGIDAGRPFPRISPLSLNFLVMLNDPRDGGIRYARIKVPTNFPPFVALPGSGEISAYRKLGFSFRSGGAALWIEDLIKAHMDILFPGYEVVESHTFRITRNADIEIAEDEAGDLLQAVREGLEQRFFGEVIRLEISSTMPKCMRRFLVAKIGLPRWKIYKVKGPLDLSRLFNLAEIDRPELKYEPFVPKLPRPFREGQSLYPLIRERDLVLYHPYDSFGPVLDFVRRAATDPKVLAIKQTLYRVGLDSPIVEALMEARRNRKQVTALVELKARFDEEQNIHWARALEEAGVHVVYGLTGYKIHAKLCLLLRNEPEGLRRYVHIGTGNYNPRTARVYADLSFFTSDEEICSDVTDLFNAITGFSAQSSYRKLLVAPFGLREGIIHRIEREIEHHRKNGNGRIVFKMNQLVDPPCIKALYRASMAGVPVELQVRGICCLKPGVPGRSENIRVTSIVGRFLEHGRFFWFNNNGDPELYIGSADLMPRNLDRRIEVLTPVEDPMLKEKLYRDLIMPHIHDTADSWELHADGTYSRVEPQPGDSPFSSQKAFMALPSGWNPVDEDTQEGFSP